jgi:Ring finger domain
LNCVPVCFQLSFDIPIQVQSIDNKQDSATRLPVLHSIDRVIHSTGISSWDDISIGATKLLGFVLPLNKSLEVCTFDLSLAVYCTADGLVEVRTENLLQSATINYWSLLVRSLSCTPGAMIRESIQQKNLCRSPPKLFSLENHSKGMLYYRVEGTDTIKPQVVLEPHLLLSHFARGLKNSTNERALINPLRSKTPEGSGQADSFLLIMLIIVVVICILFVIFCSIKIFHHCCGQEAADRDQARYICNQKLNQETRRLRFRDIDNRFNEADCCICMDSYSDEDEVLQIIRCHHFSHHSCLMHWLNRNNSCPICKEMVNIYQMGRPPQQPAEQDPLQNNLGVEMIDVDEV